MLKIVWISHDFNHSFLIYLLSPNFMKVQHYNTGVSLKLILRPRLVKYKGPVSKSNFKSSLFKFILWEPTTHFCHRTPGGL